MEYMNALILDSTCFNMLTWHCRLSDVNKHCLEEFRKHWECLDDNNQQMWHCRKAESKLNKCVFDNLVRVKPDFLLDLETNSALRD